MIEITGTYNTAKVFIDTVDDLAREQITAMCSQPFLADSRIPDNAGHPRGQGLAPSAPP